MNEEDLCNMHPPPEWDFGCPKDWVYRDAPKMSQELWQKLIDAMGEGNYKLLSYAEYPSLSEDKRCRGQMMISPEGMAGIAKQHAEMTNEQNKAPPGAEETESGEGSVE